MLERNKIVDPVAIMQVIGGVFCNPQILDMDDKYKITEEDFLEPFHKVVYGTIYNLHLSGVSEITLESIVDYLSVRPKNNAIFKQGKGEEWIIKISENTMLSAFDYYYSRLKKFTLLRVYNDYGIDITDFYDPDNIFDLEKKEKQEEILDHSTLEQIADNIDEKILKIRMAYVEDSSQNAVQAGEGTLDLIERFKISPEVGVPLYGPLINTITRGARLKKFYLRSAATGIGKAIPNYLSIPTPFGYKKVGDIKKGDFLFGRNGLKTEVLEVYPQEEKKDVWIVSFEDGRNAKCCEEHLWEYYKKESQTSMRKKVSPLKSLRKDFFMSNEREFYIPLSEPVNYCNKKILFFPYLIGKYLITHFNMVKEFFKKMEYLKGTVGQRFSLLQGLMDSVGEVSCQKGIFFTTNNPELVPIFIELIRSLGMIGKVEKKEEINTQIKYYIYIKVHKRNVYRVFKDKLKIMSKEQKEFLMNCPSNLKLKIVDIKKTVEKTYMTCFKVKNSDHLFLMNDFIVTHNTRTMIADACYIACNKIYEPTEGWIENGCKEPTLFISTEQEIEEVQTMMLAFISYVNEEHILNGEYVSDEEERVRQAAKILQESPLYIEILPDFSLKDIENKIKSNIREHDVKYIFHDYVHSSLKILEEITRRSGGIRLREDNILFMLSTRLKDICNQYGVFIMSATQLNGSYTDSKSPDQNLLRGAKAIADWINLYN